MDGPNWAQIISALGGLAGFTALTIEIWARKNRRKRPPDDLLTGLTWLQEAFEDILANGGRDPSWFIDEGRRRQETLLAVISGQIVDDELEKYVRSARMHYNDTWALSPGHKESTDPGQVNRQLASASDGRTNCVHAINRANELLRKYRT